MPDHEHYFCMTLNQPRRRSKVPEAKGPNVGGIGFNSTARWADEDAILESRLAIQRNLDTGEYEGD